MLAVSITVNPNKDIGLHYTKQLLDILMQHQCKVYMSDVLTKPYGDQEAVSQTFLTGYDILYEPDYVFFRKVSLAFVFGGDGTILKIAKKASLGGAYILGINLGKVGYLAELETHELDKIHHVLDTFSQGQIEKCPDIHIDRRMMLRTDIIHENKLTHSETALNDVVVSKGAISRMAGLTLKNNGKVISHYRADGMIVSTPTGSTAYCMSAGGPIIDPTLQCICAVPVCPYMCLQSGAVVFSEKSVIEIVFDAEKLTEGFCSVDGNNPKTLRNGDIVRITRSPFYTKLIRIKDNDFYGLLHQKLTLANDGNV